MGRVADPGAQRTTTERSHDHALDRPGSADHHVSEAHLKRYLAEFEFRYNERSALGVEDGERATKALQGIVGKRLTYRRPNEAANALSRGRKLFCVGEYLL